MLSQVQFVFEGETLPVYVDPGSTAIVYLRVVKVVGAEGYLPCICTLIFQLFLQLMAMLVSVETAKWLWLQSREQQLRLLLTV